MFYMPCAKVNICKKSLRAGAKLRVALCTRPCHQLAQSLTTEGVTRLCFHQALFEDLVLASNVLRIILGINVKFIAHAVIDEPKQWHYEMAIPVIKT